MISLLVSNSWSKYTRMLFETKIWLLTVLWTLEVDNWQVGCSEMGRWNNEESSENYVSWSVSVCVSVHYHRSYSNSAYVCWIAVVHVVIFRLCSILRYWWDSDSHYQHSYSIPALDQALRFALSSLMWWYFEDQMCAAYYIACGDISRTRCRSTLSAFL